jgi:hypothetical protein
MSKYQRRSGWTAEHKGAINAAGVEDALGKAATQRTPERAIGHGANSALSGDEDVYGRDDGGRAAVQISERRLGSVRSRAT